MMKTKTTAGLMLTLLFAMLHTACTFASTPAATGNLDSIVGNSVAGWVWNSEKPEEAQPVTVTVTNQQTGEAAVIKTTTANEHRADLQAEGIGTGNYGFHVAVDWDNLPEATYSVSVASNGTTLSRTLQYNTADGTVSDGRALVSLGTFKLTAYCPCARCSEGWGRRTSSGALATAGRTVAVDRRVIPIGTHLLINGQEYVAEDVGGAVRGNHIDIYYNTHAETTQHGTQTCEVFLIR